MTKFNQAKFESEAKKLVAKYLNYKVNEKDVIDEKEVFILWSSKVGVNAKAMLMLHKYRKIDPIKAEQFDGSLEMMKNYHITDDGFGETYTFRLDNNALPLKLGWWIVYKGTSEFLGLTLVHWRTMPDEKFRQTYREEDNQ